MIKSRFATEIALGALGLTGAWLRGRRPFIVNHLVTLRCNLACPFCYVSGPEQADFNRQRYPRSDEMDTRATRRFYRDLIDNGFKIAVMIGGQMNFMQKYTKTIMAMVWPIMVALIST